MLPQGGHFVAGTLTLNGNSASGDTIYTLSNTGNSVGTLIANLGTSAGGVGTGTLTYVDDTSAGYNLGAVTAGIVTLTELASNSTVKQLGGTGVKAMSLMLDGSSDGTASFRLDAGGAGNPSTNAVGALIANLGTSVGGVGTGTLTYVDNSTGYTLGAITAGSVTLSEQAANATISQAAAGTINLGTGTLTLNGAATNDTTYTLTNANTVGSLAASLGLMGGTLSFTDAGSYALGAITAGNVTLKETASAATILQSGALNVSGTLTLNGNPTGNTVYNLSNANNTVGTLAANLAAAHTLTRMRAANTSSVPSRRTPMTGRRRARRRTA